MNVRIGGDQREGCTSSQESLVEINADVDLTVIRLKPEVIGDIEISINATTGDFDICPPSKQGL